MNVSALNVRRFAPLSILLIAIPLGGADCDLINQFLNPGAEDGGTPAPEGCADDNFSIATAGTIAPGEEISEFLCPIRDADFWAFTVEGAGKLVKVRLWMDTNLTPVEASYTIITDSDQPTGLAGFDEGRTAGEAVDFEGLHSIAAGNYLLKITDLEGFDDRFDDVNPYHLTIEILDNPDPNEPNENAGEATPAPLDAAVTGLIGTTGDHDWFAIPVQSDAQLFDLQFRAPLDIGLELNVEVVAPDGLTIVAALPVLSSDVEYSARTRLAVSGVAGDNYYVHVYDANDDANEDEVTGTYELVVTLTPDPDANEQNGGNDSLENATILAADTTVTATIASRGDQDIYAVTVSNATMNAPQVLVVDVAFTGGVPATIQPQLQIITTNPEQDIVDIAACTTGCTPCVPLGNGNSACGEAYLQRVLSGPTYNTAFPIRNGRTYFIAINDFGDDSYLETDSYTLTYSLIPDPDPGERGDDYLIPNLQTAAYDNEEELENQNNESRARARDIGFAFQAACEPPPITIVDGGVVVTPLPDPCADAGVLADGGSDCTPPSPPACQPVVPVPNFQGAPMEPYTVTCSGQDWTMTATGRLTYEGDRDFFRFNVPDVGYWGIDVDYDVSINTPVELTVFFHDSEKVIGAFLEAQETQGSCVTSTDCPTGSVCIDETCWADDDNNNSFAGRVFPGTGQCLYVHTNFTQRPLFIEVTDNGINDYDLDMAYTLRVRVRCGCPAACDNTGPAPQCQGVAAPQ